MKTRFVENPVTKFGGRIERDSYVTPHKLDGGKRKGRSMKRKGSVTKQPRVTVAQAKAALAIDSGAKYDKANKCLIYYREV